MRLKSTAYTKDNNIGKTYYFTIFTFVSLLVNGFHFSSFIFFSALLFFFTHPACVCLNNNSAASCYEWEQETIV